MPAWLIALGCDMSTSLSTCISENVITNDAIEPYAANELRNLVERYRFKLQSQLLLTSYRTGKCAVCGLTHETCIRDGKWQTTFLKTSANDKCQLLSSVKTGADPANKELSQCCLARIAIAIPQHYDRRGRHACAPSAQQLIRRTPHLHGECQLRIEPGMAFVATTAKSNSDHACR